MGDDLPRFTPMHLRHTVPLTIRSGVSTAVVSEAQSEHTVVHITDYKLEPRLGTLKVGSTRSCVKLPIETGEYIISEVMPMVYAFHVTLHEQH